MHRRSALVTVLVLAVLSVVVPGRADAAAATGSVVTMRYGPWTIPAGTMSAPGEIMNNVSVAAKPCLGCDVLGEQPDLVYADGTSADMDTGPMLHHFVIASSAGVDTVCPVVPDRIWASGNERTDKEFPPGYGLHVGAFDSWTLLTDLMNYSSEAKTVFLSIRYRIAPPGTTRHVRSLYLDVAGCPSNSEYSVPAGPASRSWTWVAPVSGRIVFANGHQHAYGVHVTAIDASTGQLICDSVATNMMMGGQETVVDESTCAGDPIATVHAGDRIRVTSYYDAPTPQAGVMGIMHAYIYEGVL